MYIFIFICIHICLTIWHDYEAFHDHTHVHTTVHKLYSHVVTPLSFRMTPRLTLFFANFMTSKRRIFERESTFESETPVSFWYLYFVACHPCAVAV